MSTLPTSESIAAEWLRDGRRVVGATLVERIGSAPLDPGAQMLVDDRSNIEGSVTGGCVEGALVRGGPADPRRRGPPGSSPTASPTRRRRGSA